MATGKLFTCSSARVDAASLRKGEKSKLYHISAEMKSLLFADLLKSLLLLADITAELKVHRLWGGHSSEATVLKSFTGEQERLLQ